MAFSAPAVAGPTFTLSAKGGSPSVAVDDAGNGYFVWNEGPGLNDGASSTDALHYCKVPAGGNACAVTLDLGVHSRGQPFVFAPGGGRVVVVKREPGSPAVVKAHVSTDGGSSFPDVRTIAEDPGSAAPSLDSTYVPGSDTLFTILGTPGEGFFAQAAPLAGSTSSRARLFDYPNDSIRTAAIGMADANTPVSVVSTGGGRDDLVFRKGPSGGDHNSAASWGPPTAIAPGAKPTMAEGPSGLFLASTGNCGDFSCKWLLRRFDGTAFGATTELTGDQVDYGAELFQDTAGGLHFAYFASDVYHRSRAPGAADFGAARRVACDFSALAPHIAANPSGQGFVAWSGTSGSQYSTKAASLEPVSSCGSSGGAGPTMTLVGTTLRFDRLGLANLVLRCPADVGRCTGSARMLVPSSSSKLTSAAKTKSIGSGTFSIAGGKKGKARIRLTASGLKLLKNRRTLKATAEIKAKNEAGGKKTTSRKVTLRAPTS